MLDKLLLNNQEKIITNKKKIQKARIQTINKLVQKIRKLKTLNEKKPNNEKIIENLEKTMKIIVCVKKITILDIIRKVLTLSRKPAAILTNGQATPEDIAVALLANNKILVDIEATLRTLLHLDDNNPEWKDEIMQLSKRKKKLLQSGTKKTARKANKLNKSDKKPQAKKNPWKEEHLPTDVSDKSNDRSDVPPTSGWKVEPISDTVLEASRSVQPKHVAKKRVEKENVSEVIHLQKSVEEDAILQEPNRKPVTTVDSFFFTETGDNYLSTVVIDRVQLEAPDDGLIRRERRDNAIRPYQRNSNNNRKQSVQNGRVDKRQKFTPSSDVKAQVTDEKLHPSWAAKQKLKPIITEFKGQKTTFGDDGTTLQPTTDKSSNKSNFSAKTTAKVQSTEDNLHPSWAAKQRQKPAIAEFKGKKITFDD